MTAVRMMQVVANPVIGVVSVRNRFMAAPRTVDMRGVVTAAAVTRGVAVRVLGRYLDHVLVDMTLVRVMEVTLVEVIDVARVTHRRVAAAGTVLMRMTGMLVRRTSVLFLCTSEICQYRRAALDRLTETDTSRHRGPAINRAHPLGRSGQAKRQGVAEVSHSKACSLRLADRADGGDRASRSWHQEAA